MNFQLASATLVPAVTALVLAASGCSQSAASAPSAGAQQASAPILMIQYGCPTCHVIAHVPGAVGKVGPSLEGLEQRSVIAGTLQNTPENLILWLQHPQQIHPGTAMPEMGVTPADATSIAAFLQTNP
jgi:cytochrome c